MRAENAQLQDEGKHWVFRRMVYLFTDSLVARTRAAKEDAVASQTRLVTRHATLSAENERLSRKHAVGE